MKDRYLKFIFQSQIEVPKTYSLYETISWSFKIYIREQFTWRIKPTLFISFTQRHRQVPYQSPKCQFCTVWMSSSLWCKAKAHLNFKRYERTFSSSAETHSSWSPPLSETRRQLHNPFSHLFNTARARETKLKRRCYGKNSKARKLPRTHLHRRDLHQRGENRKERERP